MGYPNQFWFKSEVGKNTFYFYFENTEINGAYSNTREREAI